jgi:SAM-dependent methyltransferase
MDPKSHWERIYRTRPADKVSWYRPHLDRSLELVRRSAPDSSARIIDIGGGEATLVDDLLAVGHRNVSVLDISPTALAVAQERLRARAADVEWLCQDVLTWAPPRHRFDVWHDRAVFHFFTDPEQRMTYVRQVLRAVKPGGHVIVATFGPEAPAQCSGLDVMRYGAQSLRDEFGAAFRLIEHDVEMHRTPAGVIQQFVYCHCAISRDAISHDADEELALHPSALGSGKRGAALGQTIGVIRGSVDLHEPVGKFFRRAHQRAQRSPERGRDIDRVAQSPA